MKRKEVVAWSILFFLQFLLAGFLAYTVLYDLVSAEFLSSKPDLEFDIWISILGLALMTAMLLTHVVRSWHWFWPTVALEMTVTSLLFGLIAANSELARLSKQVQRNHSQTIQERQWLYMNHSQVCGEQIYHNAKAYTALPCYACSVEWLYSTVTFQLDQGIPNYEWPVIYQTRIQALDTIVCKQEIPPAFYPAWKGLTNVTLNTSNSWPCAIEKSNTWSDELAIAVLAYLGYVPPLQINASQINPDCLRLQGVYSMRYYLTLRCGQHGASDYPDPKSQLPWDNAMNCGTQALYDYFEQYNAELAQLNASIYQVPPVPHLATHWPVWDLNVGFIGTIAIMIIFVGVCIPRSNLRQGETQKLIN